MENGCGDRIHFSTVTNPSHFSVTIPLMDEVSLVKQNVQGLKNWEKDRLKDIAIKFTLGVPISAFATTALYSGIGAVTLGTLSPFTLATMATVAVVPHIGNILNHAAADVLNPVLFEERKDHLKANVLNPVYWGKRINNTAWTSILPSVAFNVFQTQVLGRALEQTLFLTPGFVGVNLVADTIRDFIQPKMRTKKGEPLTEHVQILNSLRSIRDVAYARQDVLYMALRA